MEEQILFQFPPQTSVRKSSTDHSALATNPMKTLALTLLALFTTLSAQEKQIILIPEEPEKPAPLFFSASANVTASISLTETTSVQNITYTIIQGIPETLTLPLSGSGKVVSVTGNGLRDWAVRSTKGGAQFLDVRPIIEDEKNPPKTLSIEVRTKCEPEEQSSLLLPRPGDTTGFSLKIELKPTSEAEIRVTQASGLSPLESTSNRQFITTTDSSLKFTVSQSGAGMGGLELLDSSLIGRLSEDSESITFTLKATVRSEAAGSSTELLRGRAALSGTVSGANHHIALNYRSIYELIADTAGDFPIEI